MKVYFEKHGGLIFANIAKVKLTPSLIRDIDIKKAQELLERFREEFGDIYGDDSTLYNMHMLLHISAYVKIYGPLDNFSAYLGENTYQLLQKSIKKPTRIEAQISRRCTGQSRDWVFFFEI